MARKCLKCERKFKPVGRYQHYCLECLREVNYMAWVKLLRKAVNLKSSKSKVKLEDFGLKIAPELSNDGATD